MRDSAFMPNGERHNPLAALIMSSEPSQLSALNWKLSLIERHGVHSQIELRKLIAGVSPKSKIKISAPFKQKFLKKALSSEIALDEIDSALLWVTLRMLNADKMSNEMIPAFHKHTRLQMEVFKLKLDDLISRDKNYLDKTRNEMKSYAEKLLESAVAKVRARVAFIEIVALAHPDELIPKLVEISPRYLGSQRVQNWIIKQQYFGNFGNAEEKAFARSSIAKLTRSLAKDRRTGIRKRHYPYWSISFTFIELSDYVGNFRWQRKEGKFDQRFFEMVCKRYDIPSEYYNLILDDERKPKELALEILTAQKKIKSPKSFREFQSTIHKLQKKHFGGDILRYAGEFFPELAGFLDLPSKMPEVIVKSQVLQVLEMVR